MAIPDKNDLIGSTVTESQFKLNLGAIVDFLKYVENQSPTYATTALLTATVPSNSPSYAKALDTGKVWAWNKPVGAPDGNYWFETELSDLDQANKFSVSASDIGKKFQFRNFSFFSSKDAPWLYPVVGDLANKVLLGFNGKTNQMFGNGIIDPKLLHSLQLYLGANQYPIVLDALNKMILGYDAAKDSLVGLFPEAVGTPKDEALPFELVIKLVNMILAYGQSLSTGVGENIVYSTTQPYSNLTFASGVRGNNGDFSGLKPLVEDSVKPTPDGEISAGETICSGAANYASLAAYKENGVLPSDHVIFASTAGHGNYSIQQLSKGSDWYNTQFINHVTGAKNLNPDIAVHAIPWLQGEANSNDTQATHYAALMQLQADAETDIKAITGQTSPVLFFTYQHSTFIYKKPAVALAMLQACQTSDKFYFIAPTYAFPSDSDNIHLAMTSYKWLSAYYGRAYKQAVHDKIRPRGIMPKSATIKGNVVKVKFNVPHTPLVLDKVNLAETFQHGFAVFDGATEILASKIYIENGDTVVLVLNATPSSTSVTVNYAIDYLATSLALFKGASGNLRDSCTDTCEVNGSTKPMYYICPHFSLSTISEII